MNIKPRRVDLAIKHEFISLRVPSQLRKRLSGLEIGESAGARV
jgi:hypothetical protein